MPTPVARALDRWAQLHGSNMVPRVVANGCVKHPPPAVIAQSESARRGAPRGRGLVLQGARPHTAVGRGRALHSVEGAPRHARGPRAPHDPHRARGASAGRGPRREPNPALARRQAVAERALRAAPREGGIWAPSRRSVHPQRSCSRPAAPAAHKGGLCTHVKKRLQRVPSFEGSVSPGFKGAHINCISTISYSSRRVQRTYARKQPSSDRRVVRAGARGVAPIVHRHFCRGRRTRVKLWFCCAAKLLLGRRQPHRRGFPRARAASALGPMSWRDAGTASTR